MAEAQLFTPETLPNGGEIWNAEHRQQLRDAAITLMDAGLLVVTVIPIGLDPNLPGCCSTHTKANPDRGIAAGDPVLDAAGNRKPRFVGKNPSYWNRLGNPALCRWKDHSKVASRAQVLKALEPITTGLAGQFGSPIGIGILTSDHTVVIDLDDTTPEAIEAAQQRFAGHCIDRTPSGGIHITVCPADGMASWATPRGQRFKAFALERMGARQGEVLSAGSFCVVPPSIRLVGCEVRRYESVGATTVPQPIEHLAAFGIHPTASEARNVNASRQVGKARQPKAATTDQPTKDRTDTAAAGDAARAIAATLTAWSQATDEQGGRIVLPKLRHFIGSQAHAVLSGDATAFGCNADGEPDRSAALTGMAREIYGWENTLFDLGLIHTETADELIDVAIAAMAPLDAYKPEPIDAKADRILAGVNRDACDTRRPMDEVAKFWADWASVELSALFTAIRTATAGLQLTGDGLWQLLPEHATTQPTNSSTTTTTTTTTNLGGLNTAADADAPYRLVAFAGEMLVFSVGETGATVFVNPTTRVKGQLIAIAPLMHWTEQFPILDGKGQIIGIDWDAAINHFLRQRTQLPVFNDDSVRGRGVWHDDGRLVIHCGDHLVVDGERMPLTAIESAFSYERCRGMAGPAADEISPQEVEQLVRVIDSFNWSEANGSLLAQGMLVVLLLGAALGWRPNAWLSGDSATGKTTLLELFSAITRCVGALSLSNESTAAGIRQQLGWDATPILFDEVEGSDRNARTRIQQVLSLMRQASSDSSAQIVKGSAGGQAVRCRIRSPFLLSSVALGLRETADRNRTVLLGLDPFTTTQRNAWANGGKVTYEALASDSELGARLLRRLIRLWAVFQTNCSVFERVAADHYSSGRLGRVYGAVLAGTAVLRHDEPFTEEQAEQMLRDGALGSHNDQAADQVPEHERCLQHLLSLQLQGVRVGADRRESCQITAAHALKVVMLGHASGFDQQVASDELLAHGVMIREMPDPREPTAMCLCAVISNNHPALGSHFADTAWADWGVMLRRCADFHARLTEKLSFGGRAFTSRGTAFPLITLVGSADELKAEQRNPAAATPFVSLPRELAQSYGLA